MEQITQIIEKNIKELIPYEKNPRKNDQSVDKVANSIKEFGFKVPIVVDKNNIIVCGHTRYKAALRCDYGRALKRMKKELEEYDRYKGGE